MKTTKTTQINAPASFVFQMLMDIDHATEWVSTLVAYEIVSGTPNEVGSIYKSQLNNNGVIYEQISEIVALVENQYVRWSGNCPYCESNVEYFLSSISDTCTELKHESECNYKGFTKFLSWIAKSKFMDASNALASETHEKFKSLVETKYQNLEAF